jgi:hypothetical protein
MDKQYALASRYTTITTNNCQLEISKEEFLKYLKKAPVKHFGIFSTCDDNSLVAGNHSLSANGRYSVMFDKTEHGKLSLLYALPYEDDSTQVEMYFNKQHTIQSIIDGYEKSLNPPFSFLSAAKPCNIFFDVKTAYQILTSRETCVKAIKDYAKQKVLDQFNKVVNIFLKNNIASANLYVLVNADSVGVDIDFNHYGNATIDSIKNIASSINDVIKSW